MAPLSRKVSVMDVSAQPPAVFVECKRVDDVDNAVSFEVDCGACLLSFSTGARAAPPGLASLAVRSRRECAGDRLKTGCLGTALAAITPSSAVDHLVNALERALGADIEFVVIWDFRGLPPSSFLTQGVAKFCEKHYSRLSTRVKSAAVLVEDTIFSAATKGLVGAFVEACIPGCPVLVCHGEAAAEEFFRQNAGCSQAPNTFVKVVDVKSTRADDSVHQGCVASLAPAPAAREERSRRAAEAPQTFHMLPNGDVRVIQSPPPDVVIPDVLLGRVLEDPTYVDKCADGTVRPARSGGDLAAISALMFKGPKECLQQLIGAHFHIGELVIDAEVESNSRHAPNPSASNDCRCVAGPQKLFLKMVRRILADSHSYTNLR